MRAANQPKTEVAAAEAGAAPVAVGGTQPGWITAPGPAAQHAPTTVAAILFQPGTAVLWRALVIIMPAVLHPLPDVAVHIVKAPGVWLKGVYGRSLLGIPFAATAITVG